MTRIIGRRVSEASPTSVEPNVCAERMPVRRRIVVPEFPQSSASFGARRPNRPVPVTFSVVLSTSSMTAPIARMQLAVETLSSPWENERMRLVPSQIDAKRSDRWPMLLSLGTGTLPTSGVPFSG